MTGALDANVVLWMPRGGDMPGGHIVQIEKTARALAATGLTVACDYSDDPDLAAVDLVHGFGLSPAEIRRGHVHRVPVVMSTIYWDRAYRSDGPDRRPGPRAVAGRMTRAARFAHAALRGRAALLDAGLDLSLHEWKTAGAYEAADLLLPNARGEAASIRRDLGVTTPMVAVPNGVDPQSFTPSPGSYAERAHVLFVGRIDPHKNQLGAIRALRGSGLPLVVAGEDHPHHPGYAQQCRDEGAGWVTFTGQVGHDSAALADLYRDARVHILPSWFETTGLVSLEAALSGCSVVSTERGHAEEYLGAMAWYCNPSDPASIRRAVWNGWRTPPSPALRQRVLDHYTWDHVAEATIAAYRSVLEPSPLGPAPR
jgi:glycosyltransferase involved in cell wall biosynthesis